MSKRHRLRAKGNCYEAAAHMVIGVLNGCMNVPHIEDGWLVHGYPTLQVPPFKPHGHAWVERKEDGVTWVYDFSNDKELRIPAALYYAAGNIDVEHCRSYDEMTARMMIVEHEHYGGWHDGPEGAL